ncbi:MAG: hypothetical protein JKY37_19550 [Nannocystaceae bacterium]|nr:hypothetical protein [Nannocystaceae bacterium]
MTTPWFRAWLCTLLLSLVGACDGDTPPKAAAGVAEVEATKAAETAPMQAPATAKSPAASQASPVRPEPVMPAVVVPTADTLESLAAEEPATEEPSKTAWSHYKAKRYDKAQSNFAQAALSDPAWKHPFNLACAAALGGEEAHTRLGLVEAVSRDSGAVSGKARRDADLAGMRTKDWFEPVLRGEAYEPPGTVKPTTPRPLHPPTVPAEYEPEVADGPLTPSPGSVSPLNNKQRSRLNTLLLAQHGVKTIIRGSVISDHGEETLAWVVYEYTRFDACMLKSTKKACRKKLRGDPDDESSNEMSCTKQFLVRAHFGTELTIDEPESIMKGACSIGKVRRMESKDFDRDGEPEVIVDATWYRETEAFREGALTEGGRFVRIAQLQGPAQFEMAFGWVMLELTPEEQEAKRFRFEDVDHDGHPDLVVQTAVMEGMEGPDFDNEAFPKLDDLELDDDESELTLRSETLLYSPSEDRWLPTKSGH